MFFKPQLKETGIIWDTWLYFHDGTYYLFYLAGTVRPTDDQPWDNTSLSTSTDGVNWTEHGPVLVKRPEATWMGTGSTWQSPNYETDGKFFMNFSEFTGPRQTIFMAESTDLLNWTRLGDEYEFVQDDRWYKPMWRWDCIWTIDRPGGGLYGYWTATPKEETGGRFGFGESLDGKTWTALAPPVVHGTADDCGEVGAIEKIGDKYYMMYGYGGMYTLVADKPEGPFHQIQTNEVLLNGHTYFSRFFRLGDDMLANHHSIARDGTVYVGLLKRAAVGDDGALWLAWWPGNDALKGEAVDVTAPGAAEGDPAGAVMLAETFDADRGFVLEGELTLPAEGGARRGLYVECGPGRGSAILVGSDGTVELGDINADGTGYEVIFTEDRAVAFGQPAKFRLLAEGELLEFYLDDILIECFSLPQAATGRIGLLRGSDVEAISNISAWFAPEA